MHFGEGADAIRREELLLIKHVPQHSYQPFFLGNGQEMTELPLFEGVQVRNLGSVWQ